MSNKHSVHLAEGSELNQRYIINSVLGEGGFGITYLAHDKILDISVVIKEYMPRELAARVPGSLTITPHNHQKESYQLGLEKFLEETRNLARLNHPNIVRVSNFLESNQSAYLIMEYEEGETLQEYLKRKGGKLSVEKCEELIHPLLDALGVIHENGLLHRDIKPANIYLRAERGPMLIDFGSARTAVSAHSRSITAIISQGYAPPEQYTTHGSQGPWTDIYALGATLYHLLTGHPPPESVQRSHQVMDGDDDPLQPLTTTSIIHSHPHLAHAVDSMLRLPGKQRPQSVDEARELLRAVDPSPEVELEATRVIEEKDRFSEEELAKLNRIASATPPEITSTPPMAADQATPHAVNTPPAPPQKVPISEPKRQPKSTQVKRAPPKPDEEITGPFTIVTEPDTLIEPITGMEFVEIPAGRFQMGGSDKNNRPIHQVEIDRFILGKFPVTQGVWKKIMGKNPSKFKAIFIDSHNHPVENVSWDDVQTFIEKLNLKSGRHYRLPTEAEWEYAARGGTESPFWSGECINTVHANYNGNYDYNNCGAKSGQYLKQTTPVDHFPANEFGLHDMTGNVWEWVEDCW
ncbi:MAG: SUMF1/EgtB/PvdO family nonheme iron enzyme, partial [Gammaproteobacteria bacterium]|nr:SUMF1/EgtB/PvdO family nonheme iron enzyme [Gammaproteobacteria bacterium]